MGIDNANYFTTKLLLAQIGFLLILTFLLGERAPDDIIISVLLPVLSFVAPSVLYALAAPGKFSQILSLKPISFKNAAFSVCLALLIQPFVMIISALTSLFFQNNVTRVLDTYSQSHTFWVTMLLICVTPALCEETAMRGAAASMLRRQPVIKGALMNGLYFALLHLSPHQFFYAFILGTMLYVLLVVTGSIIAPVLAHFSVNLSQLLLFYGARSALAIAETETGPSDSFPIFTFIAVALLSLMAFFALFGAFVKSNGFNRWEGEENGKILTKSFALMIITYALITFLIY